MDKETPKLSYASPQDPLLKTVVIRSIEQLTGQRQLQKLYANLVEVYDERETINFWAAALDQLQVKLEYEPAQLAKVPRSGPVIFIANHPYGVVDGLAICYLASLTHKNFKILINSLLCQEERVAPHLLPIDFDNTREAIRTNINTKKEAIATLRQGGAIVIFPAGGISTAKSFFGEVDDLEWKLFAAKLVQITKATVVPMYFHGHNSRMFQIVSQFGLTLRLSLIIREVKKKIGDTVFVTIGDPIYYPQIKDIKHRQELTDYLRMVTFALSDGSSKN